MEGLDLEFEPVDLELPAEEPAEVEEPLELPEGEQPEGETEELPEAEGAEEEQPTDGRKVPDDVRKALKAFRDASPENGKAAKALSDSYFREQAYKTVFPTVKD